MNLKFRALFLLLSVVVFLGATLPVQGETFSAKTLTMAAGSHSGFKFNSSGGITDRLDAAAGSTVIATGNTFSGNTENMLSYSTVYPGTTITASDNSPNDYVRPW